MSGSVALAHDYLNQRGGAERVVLELAKVFPGAPIYTTLYRPDSTFDGFRAHDIRTGWIDRLPVDERFRALLPLYPSAIRSLGTLDHDLVISSSTGWAHAVRTAPGTLHVVYCHAPARWLYRAEGYHDRSLGRIALTPVRAALTRWDKNAARRPDAYVVNSENVRRRVRAAYGFDSTVVHPPVDVDRFTPRPRGERFLVVARLLAYKRIDLVVAAATRAGLPLDVVGTGPALDDLRALAGPTVAFHGRLPDAEVTALMESCAALCFPGEEDFGITPVEALAAGKPVVAYAAGGALETLERGVTATFFDRPDVDAAEAAMRAVLALDTDPAALAASARRFSGAAFADGIRAAVARARGA